MEQANASERVKRLRSMRYEDYGISIERYKELQHFCRQYNEKKSKLQYGISAVNYDGMPHGNSTGSPTESKAIENAAYARDCNMIEKAAVLANDSIAEYIMKSVTYGLPYEDIEYDIHLGRITVGRTEFYAYRRLFYHYLNRMKLGTN